MGNGVQIFLGNNLNWQWFVGHPECMVRRRVRKRKEDDGLVCANEATPVDGFLPVKGFITRINCRASKADSSSIRHGAHAASPDQMCRPARAKASFSLLPGIRPNSN